MMRPFYDATCLLVISDSEMAKYCCQPEKCLNIYTNLFFFKHTFTFFNLLIILYIGLTLFLSYFNKSNFTSKLILYLCCLSELKT